MRVSSDALRISPGYSSTDWLALSILDEDHWQRAVAIVRDRLTGRFLRFADTCLPDPYSGFVVLSLDCLLAETIEQFRAGIINGNGKSRKLLKRFLAGPRFQPYFDEDARTHFFEDIRCGLLHQAEAKEMWLVRRGRSVMLEKVELGRGFIIDVKKFHEAVSCSLQDYLDELVAPENTGLRVNLWKKMNHISQVREERGLLYESDGDGA